MLLFASASLLGAIPASERTALIALFEATRGQDWTRNQGWLGVPGSEADWEGVRVEGDHVIELHLGSNELSGILPEQIGNLKELRWLDLSGGYPYPPPFPLIPPFPAALGGPLPETIGQLQKLEFLDLSWNTLEGAIPPSFGTLTSLQEVRLGNNRFTMLPPLAGLRNLLILELRNNRLENLPPDLGQLARLHELDLAFIGVSQISGLGELQQLEYLDVSGNFLGEVPAGVGGLRQLRTFKARASRLDSLPATIGQLENLRWIDLRGNSLESIPEEFGLLNQLEVVDLAQNQIVNLPGSFGNLQALESLDLSHNPIEMFPSPLTGLSSLRWLYLQDCAVRDLPPTIGQMSALTQFYAGDNELQGVIPEEIGNLGNLEVLDLARNEDLGGVIPSTIGGLEHLRVLRLQDTSVSGKIPPEIGSLVALEELDLARSLISGLTPELGQLVNLRKLDLFSAAAAGPIPAGIGLLPELQELDLRRNRLSGEVPMELAYLDGARGGTSFNALYTDNEALRAFLTQLEQGGPPWEETQAVAPRDFLLQRLDRDTVRFSWSPLQLLDFGDPINGFYEIYSGAAAEGPFDNIHFRTLSLKDSSAMVRIDEAAMPLFFAIRTTTLPHNFNRNRVMSDFSSGSSDVLPPLSKAYVPFIQGSEISYTGFAFTNSGAQQAFVEVLGLGAGGGPLFPSHPQFRSPPLPFDLGGGQQFVQLGSELFEIAASDNLEGWLEILTDGEEFGGLYLFGAPGKLDGSTYLPLTSSTSRFYFTRIFRQFDPLGRGAETHLCLFNPGSEPSTVELRAWFRSSSDFRVIATLEIPPRGFLTRSASQLLPASESLEAPAYLRGTVVGQGPGLLAVAWIESADSLMLLDASSFAAATSLYSAQLAVDETFSLSLKLVNTDQQARELQITATAHDRSRTLGPVLLTLNGGADFEGEVSDLFGLSPASAALEDFQGSLSVVADGPGLVGDLIVQSRTGNRFASALQLQGEGMEEALFPFLTLAEGIFTGIALLNHQSTEALVEIDLFGSDGNPVDGTLLTLAAGESRTHLIDELLPAASGIRGGYLRIRSDQPIILQELFGDQKLSFMATVPPVRLGR